ncbi:MAG: polysaccharide biosynthesis tyrosine autokinase [Actinobacteria bacterium]|nr:polysaccharide biosynthesis tyrosine autokinase [Actinomycetota bacterium]
MVARPRHRDPPRHPARRLLRARRLLGSLASLIPPLSTETKMPAPQMTSDHSEQKPTLKRELATLRRNWVIVLICVVVAPIVAYAYSKAQTPEYTAAASLLFTNQAVESRILGVESSVNAEPAREAATNLKLASLTALSVRTAKAMGSGLTGQEVTEKVSVSPEGESELVSVAATDPSPTFAARLANEFAKQFVAFGRELETAKVERAQKLAEAQLESLPEAERNAASGRALERRILELKALSTIQTGRAEIAQRATRPESPSSPNTKRNVALGIVVGILLAIAGVFLREQFDRRLRDADEIEELYGVPALATIPGSKSLPRGGHDAAVGEAVKMLRANLRLLGTGQPRRSLLITSAAPKEGKTMVAWSLARAGAAAGESVLVIEADMRRPTLAQLAGTTEGVGLGMVLAGGETPERAIRSVGGVDLLPAGPLPPNPAELLEGKRMSELLEWGEESYDRVIVDTPPASLVADALPLFDVVGAVVVVARLGVSTRDSIEHLRDHLRRLGAPLVGVVVNGTGRPSETSYYRSFATDEAPKSRRRTEGKEPAQDPDRRSNGRPRRPANRSTRS